MADQKTLATETKNVTGALTSMRVDELISNLAIGIATGQMELDRVCMQIAEFMSRAEVEVGKKPGSDEPDKMSLIELGFTPNFYQFVDTILELRVSVSSSYEETREEDVSDTQYQSQETASQSEYSSSSSSSSSGSSWGWNWGWWWWGGGGHSSSSSSASASSQSGSSSSRSKGISMHTVDAKFSSTYNYSLEASSTVKTKIVPVPPPPVFEEILRAKLTERREWEARQRLRASATALFTEVIHASEEAASSVASLTENVNTKSNEDKSTALLEAIAGIRETFTGLSNEQWAAVGTVAERRGMDEALDTARERTAGLLAVFDAGELPEDYVIADEKAAVVSSLGDFREVASAILARQEASN